MAKGKYAGVIDALPRYMGDNPDYQTKVEAVKTAMAADPDYTLHASWLAQEYTAIREEKAKIKDALSECELRLEAVSQLMANQFEVEGVTGLRTESGRNISVYLEPYATVADKEMFRLWCLADTDLARKMTLHPSVMSALTKERLLAGEPEPPGVTIYAKTKIRMGSE